MSDKEDTSANDAKSEADLKRDLLRAKLRSLKDRRIPAPGGTPLPAGAESTASPEGIEELSASEILEEVEVHPIVPEEIIEEISASEIVDEEELETGPMRFELADMGVETSAESEPEADEFEDEKTQMGTALTFEVEPEEFEDERTQLSSSPLDDFVLPRAAPSVDAPAVPEEDANPHAFSLLEGNLPEIPNSSPLPQPITGLPEPIFTGPVTPEKPEAEFSSQKTQILDSPYDNEPAVAKLRILSGPASGQEFFVSGVRNTLGRGEANTIMIPDAALSRHHIDIVKNVDDGFTIRDLQSVNGTLLNGARIREADLMHGDRVELGGTIFQFLIHGNVAASSRSRRVVPAAHTTLSGGGTTLTDSNHLMGQKEDPAAISRVSTYIVGVAIFLVVLLLIGFGFLMLSKNKGPAANPELASQLYLQGVDAKKERNWAEAQIKFEEAKALDPQLAIQAQLKTISDEREAKARVDQAKKLADEGNQNEVTKLLAEIPRDSVYYEESRNLSRRPVNTEVDTLYTQAQENVTREDFEGAKALIAKIHRENPKHQGAKDLEERIRRIELEKETQRLTKENEEATRPIIIRDAKAKKPSRMINFTEGYRLYKTGKFDEAITFFNNAAANSRGSGAKRAKKAAKDISSFQTAYRAGKLAYAKRDWSVADKKLTQAKRLDSAIAGGKGYFRDEIADRLAGCKGQLGLQALKAKSYARAFRLLKDGEGYDKGNSVVKELSSKLDGEARNLYVKAANAKKTNANAAAKYCRQVMSMTAKSDPTHKKAEKLLKAL